MVELDKSSAQRKPLIRSGRFRRSYKYEGAALLIWALISAVGIGLILYFSYQLGTVYAAQEMDFEAAADIMWILMLGWLIACVFSFTIISSGGLCTYSAGETEFVIKGPGRKQEIFYYSDVYEVRYEPIRLLFLDRGYLVTITTGVRDITYRYLYGDGKRNRRIEDSPFYYLEYNCGLCEKDDAPPPDLETVKEMIAVGQYQRSYERIKEEDDSFF